MAWQISILKALQNWTSKNGWFSHKPWWFYILFISSFQHVSCWLKNNSSVSTSLKK